MCAQGPMQPEVALTTRRLALLTQVFLERCITELQLVFICVACRDSIPLLVTQLSYHSACAIHSLTTSPFPCNALRLPPAGVKLFIQDLLRASVSLGDASVGNYPGLN